METVAGAADARFFRRAGPHTLRAIAAACGATLAADADPDQTLRGVAPIGAAGPDEVSFLDNRKFRHLLAGTGAGAVLLAPAMAADVPAGAAALVTDQVHAAWARIATLFHPPPPVVPGIHPTAIVDGADVHPTASVGPYAVIGAGASVGAGTAVGAQTVIGGNCTVGADCRIAAQVSVSHALIGDRVVLHPGVRIGQDGFGFAMTERGYLSVPQLGRVIVGDDVDIGANTTVDRGSLGDTVIGAGSRLDNLVQIGHNVRLGRGCVVVAQAGIAGSTVLEDYVVVAAQAGLLGHLHVGARARIGGRAGVISDIEAGTDVLGTPAMPNREYLRIVAAVRRLARRDKGRAGEP